MNLDLFVPDDFAARGALQRQVFGRDSDTVTLHSVGGWPLGGWRGKRGVCLEWQAQQLGGEAVPRGVAGVGVIGKPNPGRDRLEHGFELDGAGAQRFHRLTPHARHLQVGADARQ